MIIQAVQWMQNADSTCFTKDTDDRSVVFSGYSGSPHK